MRSHVKMMIINDLNRIFIHKSINYKGSWSWHCFIALATDILQTSSEISGKLPTDYQKHIGNILDAMLPAGSITGAPKDKTMEIIHEAEGYDRGFYTGIMGIYKWWTQLGCNDTLSWKWRYRNVFQGRRRHYFEEWLQKRIRGSITKSVSSFWIELILIWHSNS